MEFKLNKSQKEIQKAAREFAKGEFEKDLAIDLDKKQEFLEPVRQKAADLGFIGMHFDENYSGSGLGIFDTVLVAEAFCQNDSGMGSALMLSGYGAECLHQFGNEDPKQLFLPLIAEGKMTSGCAFFEPETGFDLSKVKTIACLRNSQWRIDGEKIDVINGGNAGIYITLCKTDLNAPPDKAFSLFVVEPERRGVKLEPLGQKLGTRMVERAKLELNCVKIPEVNLIGKKGKGLVYLKTFFNQSRVLTSAISLGIAQGALDRSLAYIKQREQFNRKIAQFEGIRHKMAEMSMKVELARLITYRAAWEIDQKKTSEKHCSMAKLYATQAAVSVADDAIQLLGGYGYMTEYEIERFYRDAKAISLFELPGIDLKNRIAESVIGKIKN